MKKLIVLNLLLLICLLTTGQISGKITDNDFIPVESASIINTTNNLSCISDSNGVFVIQGSIGDSIQIQHINHDASEFRINVNNDKYFLATKNYYLDEVVVSSNEAFNLFKRSCNNTFNKLSDKTVSKGYLRYLKMNNYDTIVAQYLDLDVVRKKLKNFDDGEKISVFKIQERTISDSIHEGKELKLNKFIAPPINQFDWDIFSKSYNYFKTEDSYYIKLYFLSKTSFSDSEVHYEVIIQKKDSCLLLVAKTFRGSFISKKGAQTNTINLCSLTKYNLDNGVSYLAETFDHLVVPDPKESGKIITISLNYITYDKGIPQSKVRKAGKQIRDNIFDPDLVKNRYVDNFWKNNSEIGDLSYDFEYLFNFKIKQ